MRQLLMRQSLVSVGVMGANCLQSVGMLRHLSFSVQCAGA